MRNKTLLIFSVVLVALVIIGGVMYQQLDHSEASVEVEFEGFVIKKAGESFYKQNNNLEDLEQDVDLIIIGEPTKNLKSLKQSQIKLRENEILGEFWVDTPVKVHQVIKGEFEEEEIIIAQHIFMDLENDYVFTPSGYSPLVENAQYVLFLAKSDFGVSGDQEFAWNIMSYNHGKYNLDGRDHIEDQFSDNNQLKLKREVVPKYLSLKKND
ncbi:hypothetical protein [Bacillus horti]|uniref:Uncharacterized protein n=1 Tax=Caldalkalibacillus horti TaxID=77523 RepID=A0ABT9VWI9_9BACI|nr:hypothetical protein [Bacillus horti]MDQ0165260.1 hypothetical protein [Bacillus horti]